ncbi:MAG: NADH-quinone oxidoreductase subunit NuoH [bacterium]|nr:NADH-quinone oxidoreductase subunit NuoH [bacterium]
MVDLQRLAITILNLVRDICTENGLPPVLTEWIVFGTDVAFMFLVAGVIAAFIAIHGFFVIWMERKVSAHIQSRLGPMRVGYHGILQSIADTIKLLLKENIMPEKVDKLPYLAAPVVVMFPAFMAFLVIPFDKGLIPKDLNLGLLYILAIGSIAVIGIFMAGWSSYNKYSLIGGMRTVAQIVSYEVPLLLSVISVVMMVGSLSMVSIVEAQKSAWFIFIQPLAFIIYFIAATAETNRTPFDIPEAESELVAGFHTEYSGMKFAIFFVAEYTNIFTVSAIATTLFFGGWQGPFFPSIIWFLLKTYFLVFVLMWFRWTFPRVRVDQMMTFGWKVLTPLAFMNIAITGLLMLIFNK